MKSESVDEVWEFYRDNCPGFKEPMRKEFRKLDEHVTRLEAENAKLRDLCKRLIGHVEHPPCEGCGFEMNCDGSDLTQCDEWSMYRADARKLGIEVDG